MESKGGDELTTCHIIFLRLCKPEKRLFEVLPNHLRKKACLCMYASTNVGNKAKRVKYLIERIGKKLILINSRFR